ncbi:MAG: antitoxin VbhA family protein [Cellulomonadaceae bacterium]|nr:antitoxin VbhA family protein [Cellulomonadaceae bacterium]
MTEGQRQRLLIDTFASLALEGMEPTARDLAEARDYIAGRVTIDELIARAKAEYRANLKR